MISPDLFPTVLKCSFLNEWTPVCSFYSITSILFPKKLRKYLRFVFLPLKWEMELVLGGGKVRRIRFFVTRLFVMGFLLRPPAPAPPHTR